MTDDIFGLRLTRDLQAYAEGGLRPIDVLAIARGAIGTGTRPRASRAGFVLVAATADLVAAARRRTAASPLPLVLVAALLLVALIALALSGAGGRLLNLPTVTSPSPAPMVVAPTAAPPTLAVDAPAYEAIYLRPVADGIDVVAVRPDGQERLLRRIGTTLPDSKFPLVSDGSVSENGWLAISTSSSGQLPIAAYGLFDLSNPTRDPLTVPYPPVIGGRWSPNGLFAVSSARTCAADGTCWMAINIVDPRTGMTIELGRIGLFGGGPSIVWARDGSGILDGGQLKPVQGGPDVAVDPGLLFTDRRVGRGGSLYILLGPGGDCPGVTAPTIRERDLASDFSYCNGTDWYVSHDKQERPTEVIFANDGRSLLVMLERVSGQRHTAVVGRIDSPGHFVQLATYDLPAGGSNPEFSVDPDDSAFPIEYSTGPSSGVTFVQGPILHRDGTMSAVPAGSLAGYVPGPLVESWPGVGSYGPAPVPTPTPVPVP